MSYHQAVWLEKNCEEKGVLPSTWVRGKLVMWPLSKMNALKLIRDRVEPGENWQCFKLIKIKNTSDSYEDCNSYDVTTATEEEDIDIQWIIKKNLKTILLFLKVMKKLILMLMQKMQLGFLKGKASVLSQSICLLTGKFNSRIPLLRQRAPISKDNVVDQPKFQRKVLYQLANLANEIKDLRIAVEMMGIPSSEHIESVEVHLEIIAGPIQTLNGYRNLEEQCGILANKTTLFQLLSRIGGTSSKGTSKNLLKRLFSNFVMSHLSMDGIGTLEKLPFRDTALCQLVVEYIMKRDCSSTVSEIHSFLGSHLRMAPFRIGGTGKSHLNAHFSSSQDGEAGLINLIKNDEDHHEDDLDLDGNNDY